MSNDFHSTAIKIISESIKSAIFIDDNVLMPFEETGTLENHEKLFCSFRERDSSLDLYRFKKEEWISKSNYLFSNRDLVILDWQLTSTSPTYSETLKVLENILFRNNIHFCCIYTDTDKSEFAEKILFPILAYFSYNPKGFKLTNEKRQLIYNDCIDFIKESGVDTNDFCQDISVLAKEFAFSENDSSKAQYLKESTANILSKHFTNNGREFFAFLKQKDIPVSLAFIVIGYVQEIEIPSVLYPIIRVSTTDLNYLSINDTIITIKNKGEISDLRLYEDFTKSLLKEHNIFLTLLGLEMKNLVRKSSAFMGKDLNNINPLAFYYHQSTVDSKDDFVNFIKELWIDQASSFLIKEDPLLVNYIDEFKDIFKIGEPLDEFKKNLGANPKYNTALGELNRFYNQVKDNRARDSKIRFGDIFYFQKNDDDEKLYLMCLTPHCDCADSEIKIGNKFYFISGKKMENIVSGLKRSEKDYISFLKDENGNLACIDWEECKPFTIYIPENKLNALNKIYFSGEFVKLEYLCSIKENHVQRLSNHAFAYPLRVGITMAKIKE